MASGTWEGTSTRLQSISCHRSGAARSEYDNFVVSHGTVPLIHDDELADAGTSPHWPVATRLEEKPGFSRKRSVVGPKPLSRKMPTGCVLVFHGRQKVLVSCHKMKTQTVGRKLPVPWTVSCWCVGRGEKRVVLTLAGEQGALGRTTISITSMEKR